MILVTGATGHLGNVLIRHLADTSQERIRILAERRDDVSHLPEGISETIYGDISDPDDVMKAVRSCRRVYHLAGLISLNPRLTEKLYRVNVLGTQNVVNACLQEGVERLLYTSSVDALYQHPRGQIITETLDTGMETAEGGYARSKILACRSVLDGIGKGLDAVIVYPATIIGPEDHRRSLPQRAFQYYCTQFKSKFCFEGAYNFVDVRDVADGICRAMEVGRKGEGYILSGETLTIEEIARAIAGADHAPLHLVKVPGFLLRPAVGVMAAFFRLRGKEPPLNGYALKVLRRNGDISNAKARKELGFAPRDIRESIRETIAWGRQKGIIA
jgi:dihydroflavonol-4-reductase